MNTHLNRSLALALAGVLACGTGFAEDDETTISGDAAVLSTDEVNRERAREAVEAAAAEAAEAVRAAIRLDLDIRLVGPTSVKIAGEV